MMKFKLFTLFFIATCAGYTWATDSNIYKCGTTYSQTPCAGAVAVQVQDARTKEQKLQSDAAIMQQGKAANAMEKARLTEEAQARVQNKPAKPATTKAAKAQSKSKTNADALALKHRKGGKKENEFFTAKEATPTEKK